MPVKSPKRWCPGAHTGCTHREEKHGDEWAPEDWALSHDWDLEYKVAVKGRVHNVRPSLGPSEISGEVPTSLDDMN